MAKQVKAIVKPELLIWARESMNISVAEAAHKIAVTADQLSSWEAGEASPTIAQLRKAAQAYKRPLAVFYLPAPPKDFEALRDFRRLPDRPAATRSPELNLEIRRAYQRREVALELMSELGSDAETVAVDRSALGDPEKLAVAARRVLGVALEQQFGWRDKYQALNSWIRALETAGVLVFQTSDVDLGEMRGFSISTEPLPVIVVNAKDSPRGRVFTLIHEFTHILINRGGLCDLETTTRPDSESERIEVFCNQVAGSLLIPADALLREPTVSRKPSREAWTEEEIRFLAERYSVSQEALLRRLLSLGRISQSFYRTKREELLKAYQRESEASEGFAPYHRVKLRDLGRSYTRLVLEAYHQEAINSADLADYLGLRLKHIPKIELELAHSRL